MVRPTHLSLPPWLLSDLALPHASSRSVVHQGSSLEPLYVAAALFV